MANLSKKAFKWAFGTSNARRAGMDRTLRGLRTGNSRDLYMGLALTAIAYLQRTRPRKQRIYRQEVSEGAALVIYKRGSGTPKLEIVRPK